MEKCKLISRLLGFLFFAQLIHSRSAAKFYNSVIDQCKRTPLDTKRFQGVWHQLYSEHVGQYCFKSTFERTAQSNTFKWSIIQQNRKLYKKLYTLNADRSLTSERNGTKTPLLVFSTDYVNYAILYENISSPILGEIEFFTLYGRKSHYFDSALYSKVVGLLHSIGHSKKLQTVYQGKGCAAQQNSYLKQCRYNSTVTRNRIKLERDKFLGHWYSLYSTSLGQSCTDFELKPNPSDSKLINYEAFQSGISLDQTELEFDDNEKVCERVTDGVKTPMNIFDTDYRSYAIFYQSGKTSDGLFEYFAIHGRKPEPFNAQLLNRVKSKLSRIGFDEDLYEVYQGDACRINMTFDSIIH